MRYTASSVKKSLLKNKKLSAEGLDDLMCPQRKPRVWVWDNNAECCGNAATCSNAIAKSCKQRINIYYNGQPMLLTVLNFYFTISKTNHDGFIDKDDVSLGRLIDKGLVDVAGLQLIP